MRAPIIPRSIYPLVLCGGMGARLWPMSRVDQPKQFQPTSGAGSASFFQTTLLRHRGPRFHNPIVVANARHGPIVNRQMRELQLPGTVIAEPVARNTGPAVLAAAFCVLRDDPDAILLVLPSDHIIKGDLNDAVCAMTGAADAGRIITFGVPPRYAETGYGYVTDGGENAAFNGLHDVASFVEKPSLDEAKALIATGRSYWASGISLFRADVLVEEYRRFDLPTAALVEAAVARSSRKDANAVLRGHILLEEKAFSSARNQPTERAVFELTDAIALAPLRQIDWDDVGAWNAVHQIAERSSDENMLTGDVVAIDTHNSLVQSDGRLVAIIGMDNLVVVDTPDALLVTNRDRAQDVKRLVDHLLATDRAEVQSHVSRDTSWGQVEMLARASSYELRLITVNPGARLSINGTGSGPSLLTVVSGIVDCGHGEGFRRMTTGQSLPIESDHALPVQNTHCEDLRLIQITFTHRPEGELRAALDPARSSKEIHFPPVAHTEDGLASAPLRAAGGS